MWLGPVEEDSKNMGVRNWIHNSRDHREWRRRRRRRDKTALTSLFVKLTALRDV
jgi:hypothetical protein